LVELGSGAELFPRRVLIACADHSARREAHSAADVAAWQHSATLRRAARAGRQHARAPLPTAATTMCCELRDAGARPRGRRCGWRSCGAGAAGAQREPSAIDAAMTASARREGSDSGR
jgi:hypothetical protein